MIMVVTDEVQPSVGQKTARKWVKSAPDIPTSLVAFTAKAVINGGLKSSAKARGSHLDDGRQCLAGD